MALIVQVPAETRVTVVLATVQRAVVAEVKVTLNPVAVVVVLSARPERVLAERVKVPVPIVLGAREAKLMLWLRFWLELLVTA